MTSMTRPDRASLAAFVAVCALAFAGSAAVTVAWCGSMAEMEGMPMPGGWAMSMTWMRMPAQTWLDAAASFVAMWMLMMVAMMLPAVAPQLWRYRAAALDRGHARGAALTALAAVGYFCVWTAIGIALFPAGVALAEVAMRSSEFARAVPLATGAAVLLAGALQFTVWKARRLACCCQTRGHERATSADTAWRYGLRLGADCSACCVNLTAILLVIGVMDLWAMAFVTIAITLERLAPARLHVERFVGVAAAAAGLVLIASAVAAV